VYFPYEKGVSGKLKSIWSQYNIRATLKTKSTLQGSLMKSRLEKVP
jgi:hypothetical protein